MTIALPIACAIISTIGIVVLGIAWSAGPHPATEIEQERRKTMRVGWLLIGLACVALGIAATAQGGTP